MKLCIGTQRRQRELLGEHTPETEAYGISSFVYRSRRPFHPARFHEAIRYRASLSDRDQAFLKAMQPALLRDPSDWTETSRNLEAMAESQVSIVANPLILGCAAGLIAQAFHVRDLGPLSDVLNLLGQAAMPIAIICVGAGLDFKAVRAARVKVATASLFKLIIAPAVMWGAATLVGASPLAAAVAAGVGSTPTAAAGYTLAREMGGDPQLMAAIITATTLLSFFTMPIAIASPCSRRSL